MLTTEQQITKRIIAQSTQIFVCVTAIDDVYWVQISKREATKLLKKTNQLEITSELNTGWIDKKY